MCVRAIGGVRKHQARFHQARPTCSREGEFCGRKKGLKYARGWCTYARGTAYVGTGDGLRVYLETYKSEREMIYMHAKHGLRVLKEPCAFVWMVYVR